jgi:phage protein D
VAAEALDELARRHEDFYVPTFTLLVGEQDVVRELFLTVSSVQLDLKERTPGQFSFTVANAFDLERREFVAMRGVRSIDLFELFAFGSPVRVRLGYGAGTALEMSGLVTELSTSFTAGGTPELTIKGFDALYPLTIGKSTRNWEGKRDSDAIADVARDRGITADPEPTEPVRPRIDQSQQTDLAFVETLARRNQSTFYLRGDELYFGRPHNRDTAIVSLSWGFGLVSFAPEANLARQIAEVRVHARSATEGKEITGIATRRDITGADGRGSSGSDDVVRALSSSPVLDVRAPVHTQAEADERAKAILDERAQDFVRGSGECIGLPEIVPDVNIELGGMGRGFSKTYWVSEAAHKFDRGGYSTSFTVQEPTVGLREGSG